ncbi:MAG: leucine-rich repeat domain-containing protein, partial [Planctomycetota bacterium]
MLQRNQNQIATRILSLASVAMSRQLRLIVIIMMGWGLVAGVADDECSAAEIALKTGGTKVLHFPADRSLGKLFVEDKSDGWNFIGPAQGDVVVPADRNIKLQINFREPRPIDLSGLSKLGPSDIHELSLQSSIRRTSANRPALESIAHLTGLQVLSLGNTGVTGRQMASLKSLSSLRSLIFIRENSVGSAGLAVLKDLPALEYLDCYTRPIDAGLKHLAQLPKLRRLRLRMGGIRGPGLAYLADMPRLERLTLWGTTGLTDQHVRYLEGLTRLKSLKLWGGDVPLTDASLASISKLAALEELHFVRVTTDFTDAGIGQLANLTKLRILGASPQDASVLAGMEQLESVSGIVLTSRNMKALAGLGNLKSLGLALEAPARGSAVAMLGELKSLEKLYVGRQHVFAKSFSDEELACLESLSRLKHLSITTKGITERGWASIGRLSQ